jgi:DedD protein
MSSSRSGSQGTASTPPPSIETLRRRARHRLIGATVLVGVGVVGFPLLFDTQPRPIAVDVPIDIPSRPAPGSAVGPAAKAAPAPAPVAAAPKPPVIDETETPPKPAAPAPAAPVSASPAPAPTPAPPPAPAPASAAAPSPASPPKPPTDGARAEALLNGKPAPTPAPAAPAGAAQQRLVVQVGAFADATRARETRQKLERAGLKTYVHEAQTPEGKRIRVRVGPFDSRAEADKAAAKVKGLGLPAAVLTL